MNFRGAAILMLASLACLAATAMGTPANAGGRGYYYYYDYCPPPPTTRPFTDIRPRRGGVRPFTDPILKCRAAQWSGGGGGPCPAYEVKCHGARLGPGEFIDGGPTNCQYRCTNYL